MNRKEFIGSVSAFAGLSSLRAFGLTATETKVGAKLKFGVCSDLHLGPWNKGVYFERACQWWNHEGVDAVMIAGDLTDSGDMTSLAYVRDTLDKVFGEKWPEMLICWGNHDVGRSPDHLTKENKEKVLREWFKMGEIEYPMYLKKVKGYTFVGCHFEDWKGPQNLDAFLATHADDINDSKPFFYFQHLHPRCTCNGSGVWGQDDGKSTDALSKYPQAISFSGHSHTSLTDERTVWQGAFTSVGTASLSSIDLPSGRENGPAGWPEAQMEKVDVGWGHHALMATVCDDRIVLERREFQFSPEGDELGEAWVVPLDGTRPLAFEQRASTEVAPAFAADAKLTVSRRKGPVRDKKLPEEEQWVVSFPTAPSRDGRPRAFDYEVVAVCETEDVTRRVEKRVWSKWCFLEEKRDPNAECVFGVKELPPPGEVGCTCEKFRGTVRFEVRPVAPFGRKGEPIVSETYPLSMKRESEKPNGK